MVCKESTKSKNCTKIAAALCPEGRKRSGGEGGGVVARELGVTGAAMNNPCERALGRVD
jgi:hypothetical protein